MSHLSRTQSLTEQSNWSTLIESITGMKVIGLMDSTKIRQTKFFHHDSQHDNHDVHKNQSTRGYVEVVTTTSYAADMIGRNCTHGGSSESHLFNWITSQNINKFNELFDFASDLIISDRGCKVCLLHTAYWLLYPALFAKKTWYLYMHILLLHCGITQNKSFVFLRSHMHNQ